MWLDFSCWCVLHKFEWTLQCANEYTPLKIQPRQRKKLLYSFKCEHFCQENWSRLCDCGVSHCGQLHVHGKGNTKLIYDSITTEWKIYHNCVVCGNAIESNSEWHEILEGNELNECRYREGKFWLWNYLDLKSNVCWLRKCFSHLFNVSNVNKCPIKRFSNQILKFASFRGQVALRFSMRNVT